MDATSSDSFISFAAAISRKHFQNASSTLMLVLWPAITMERFIQSDCVSV